MNKGFSRAKVLIVDDLPANIRSLKRLLASTDVDVDEALGGEQALEMMLAQEYALILLDVQMPEMNGYEVAEMMANFEATKFIPIVFVTANAAEDLSAIRGYEAGAIDFITKPLNKTILLGKIKVLLQLYEQRQQLSLVNQQLRKSLEDVKAANEVKEVFLANMSHEMRTPLNAIVGATELLSQTELTEAQANYGSMILNSSDFLLSLINDVLDYSKLESAHVVLAPESVDLCELIRNVVHMLGARAFANHVELLVRYPQQITPVMADPVRLKQILVNLVSNAIKFSKDSYVLIELQVLRENDSSQQLLLRVKDGGVGIAADRLDKIFDRFVQEDSSTTKKYGGTGLGLSISRKLADLMAAKLSVESELGKGSVFSLQVELARVLPSENENSSPVERPSFASERALIVDGSERSAQLIAEQLDGLAIENSRVSDAEQALQALSSAAQDGRDFSFVLIDHKQNDTGTQELANAIRALSDIKPVKIIGRSCGCTPQVFASDSSGEQASFDAHFVKPQSTAELQAGLCSLLALVDQPSASSVDTAGANDWKSIQKENLRVLVVDDSPINQVCTEAMLSAAGCAVVLAENGEDALDKFESQDFDLVLMDCMMPVMDGYEATRKIRALPDLGGTIPIIAMTANALDGDREKCLAAGMTDYITKPIHQQQLVDTLDQHLAA